MEYLCGDTLDLELKQTTGALPVLSPVEALGSPRLMQLLAFISTGIARVGLARLTMHIKSSMVLLVDYCWNVCSKSTCQCVIFDFFKSIL